ncbi:disease resistance protein RUN1 [Trifolium repens]|nr:disease resistance protein RUN1 [Trifolium repens]
MECRNENEEDSVVVIPVFYQIEPTHVRKQTGSYGSALEKHKKQGGKNDDKIMRNWKNALFQAANLSGFDSNTYRSDSDLIEDIIRVVLGKLNHNYTNDLTYDVHTLELLQNLIGVGHGWLGAGSMVIVTTRDKHVLISNPLALKEVCDVLKNSRGTEIVEAIFFDASEYTNISLSPKAFEKMKDFGMEKRICQI